MTKTRTPAQLANDERLRSRKTTQTIEADAANPVITDVQGKQRLEDMQRQMNELMESNALLKAAFLGQNQSQGNGVTLGRDNRVLGEVDKYLIDPTNYPDPTPRLAEEKRLQTIAFNHNYELDYTFTIRSYETKSGVNMREPEFLVVLNRIVLDSQGEPLTVINPKTGKPGIKMYRARRMVFHEDPQAALVLARENNLLIDKEDEKTFLDEMRYLRVRDWLFDIFWPKAADEPENIHEEVIGGSLVQVFTKSSEGASQVDFDSLTKAM